MNTQWKSIVCPKRDRENYPGIKKKVMAWAQTLVLHVDDAVGHVCDYYDWSEFNCKQTPRVNHSFPKRSGKKKHTKKTCAGGNQLQKKNEEIKSQQTNPPKNISGQTLDSRLHSPSGRKTQKKNSKKRNLFRRLVYTTISNKMLYTFVQHFFPAGLLFTCRISSQLKKTTQFLGPSLLCV